MYFNPMLAYIFCKTKLRTHWVDSSDHRLQMNHAASLPLDEKFNLQYLKKSYSVDALVILYHMFMFSGLALIVKTLSIAQTDYYT